MVNWRVIKDKEGYDQAMARLLELAGTELVEDSEEFDELELLSLLIGHYEEKHYAIDKPDPIEAIKFRMDQLGLSQADMRQYLGSPSKVSEVLSGRRKLSLSMIRRIHDGLGIPADILIQDSAKVEWSPVTYSAEALALAFNDSCKSPPENGAFVERITSGITLNVWAKQVSSGVSSKIQLSPSHVTNFSDCC